MKIRIINKGVDVDGGYIKRSDVLTALKGGGSYSHPVE